jgi:3-hydroxyisobutyrate dehydrogenase-like beta-hydroxyacid dehydrogenase
MSAQHRTAVIGLGAMGGGMARAALAAGLEVWGADLDPGRAEAFRAEGGLEGDAATLGPTLASAAIVTLTGAQTEAALFGEDGLARHLSAGAVVLSCATMAPEQARALAAEVGRHGLLFLDAPISGGAGKAAEGRLSVMASGAPEAFAAARPLLDAVAETVFELGPEPGAGSAMKAVNQLLAGVHIAAAAEAVVFAAKQGIPPATTLETIARCAGTSWMFENRVPHIVEADYAPRSAVDIWPKDLGIVAAIAKAEGVPVPIAEAALARFKAAQAAGLGREDDAAVAKIYAEAAGVTLPGAE